MAMSITDLQNYIAQYLPTNTRRAVTAATLRTVLNQIASEAITPWQLPIAYSELVGLDCTATAPATCAIYNGSTYICSTDHTAGASFDSSKWIMISASGDSAADAAISTINAYLDEDKKVLQFKNKADAIASPYISTDTYIYIKGRRFKYAASAPSHVLYMTHTATSRVYVFDDTFIDEDLIADADFINGNRNNAATAGFMLDKPLILSSLNSVAILTVDFTGLTTDAARGTQYANACGWRAKCLYSNGAKLIVRTPTGETRMSGQVNNGYISIAGITSSGMEPNPLILQTGTAVSVYDITAFTFGAKYGKIVRCSVDVDSAGNALGSGYADTFPVTASGGGVSGFAATGYASGGVPTGIVITSNGTCTGTPTLDLSAGGGSGGSATATVNLNVIPCTITLATFPGTLTVGQPIGVGGYPGGILVPRLASNGDGEWAVGCQKVLAYNAGAKTISYEFSSPQSTGPSNATTVTNGQCSVPNGWIVNTGGYDGGLTGIECAINFNDSTLVLDGFWMLWGDGDKQKLKVLQKGIGGGRNGKLNVNDRSGIGGFPDQQIRINASDTLINRLYLGGGATGVAGMKIQGGGRNVISSFWAGGFNGDNAVTIPAGVFVEISNANIGAGSNGIRQTGGTLIIQESTVAGSVNNINADDGSVVNFVSGSAASPNPTMILKRGNVNLTLAGPCNVIGHPTFTSPITANAYVPPNSSWRGINWADDGTAPWRTIHDDGSGSNPLSAAGVPLLPSTESGTGTPEGVIARARGSMFLRTDTGAIYSKTTTGGSNTGWAAL